MMETETGIIVCLVVALAFSLFANLKNALWQNREFREMLRESAANIRKAAAANAAYVAKDLQVEKDMLELRQGLDESWAQMGRIDHLLSDPEKGRD